MRFVIAPSIALALLAACGDSPPPAAPVVTSNVVADRLKLLNESDASTVLAAIATLQSREVREGPDASKVVTALAAVFLDPRWSGRPEEWDIRRAAGRALDAFGPMAQEARSAILRALGMSNIDESSIAVLADALRRATVSSVETAQLQLRSITGAIDLYYLEQRSLPKSLDDLTTTSPKGDEPFFKRIPLDPWGGTYRYRIVDARTREVWVSSAGADKVWDTADDLIYPDAGERVVGK